ncbi:MAG: hypothetical protein LBK22_02230 [Tannerella sp.]|jgi:hypothetical protein|nr:hypothetical protein [Tannerella sp.]
MKTNFLLTVSALLLTGMSLKAQITLPKEWNFANDSTTWPTNPTGVAIDPTTIDGLTFWFTAAGGGSPSNLGKIDYTPLTYNSVTYNRYLSLGNYSWWAALNPSNPKPNQRFMSFDVSGSCIVKVILAAEWNGVSKIYITDGKADGTAFIDSIIGPTNKTDVIEGSVTYKGGATTLYIGGANGTALAHYLSIKVEPYVSSQNYEWNFGLDQSTFPLCTGYTADTTIAGLTVHSIATTATVGEVATQAKSFNGTDYVQAFNLGGAGLWGSDFEGGAISGTPLRMMPRQRYLSFNVSGSVTVTARLMLRYSGGTGRIFVTDGTNLIGTMNVLSNTAIAEQSVSYTGSEDKTLYVFGDGAMYFFHLKVEPYVYNPTGIDKALPAGDAGIVSVAHYDLTGRLAAPGTKGILLRKTVYENGQIEIEKTAIIKN